eukprot:CAMPEP_0196818860 /NCGR_PEP_ID=MMETSP1362-20130617/67818_1 /TAXON_ID=163516 /ORGANISM="Leptocylindrus danicus, Strain CCMP1856" /LENGTH=432 /DNA_ID=CAMNT_0042197127 /DNA_START=71 /DNA_END=1366 /DNA_ORIENTATION=+
MTTTPHANINVDCNDKHAYWHVRRAAESLSGSMLLQNEVNRKDDYTLLVSLVQEVLLSWHDRWSGQSKWQSFLNKSSLLHEVEESIVALHNLLSWLGDFEYLSSAYDDGDEIVVVDLCSGKGVFSMLLAYLQAKVVASSNENFKTASDNQIIVDDNSSQYKYLAPLRKIGKCIMIDRMTRRKCNWHHIDEANDDYCTRMHIELWSECNVHDENFLSRLQNVPGQLAIVGIHLCRTLSPRCLSIGNTFGYSKVPFLCLAPCCLPRIGSNQVQVLLYETESDQSMRLKVRNQRNRALQKKKTCSICLERSHGTKYCPSLPDDPDEKKSILYKYRACWRCGMFGHDVAECTEARMPSLIDPPSVPIDLAQVDEAESPFDNYCQQLLESIQSTSQLESKNICIRKNLRVVLLEGNKNDHDTPYSDNNKIGQRKCTW